MSTLTRKTDCAAPKRRPRPLVCSSIYARRQLSCLRSGRAFPTLMSSTDLKSDARSQPWWEEFEQVRDRERFFHWELEFPEVFADGGFDCVLGNPPWDKVTAVKDRVLRSTRRADPGVQGRTSLIAELTSCTRNIQNLADEFASIP